MTNPRTLAHQIIGSECQFDRHDAICERIMAGLKLARNEALEEAAETLNYGMITDCEDRGIMDPATGEVQCAAEDRGSLCACDAVYEFSGKRQKAIRALKEKPNA